MALGGGAVSYERGTPARACGRLCDHLQAKRQHLKRVSGLLPGSQVPPDIVEMHRRRLRLDTRWSHWLSIGAIVLASLQD